VAEELPEIDRPLRFTVMRGARGSVKAESVEELHEALERPFTDTELQRDADPARHGSRRSRVWTDGPRGPGDGHGARDRDGRRGGHDKGTHRPGSPSGRGKRRGRDR